MAVSGKIYVIVGRTGEYSDASEWPVCWRGTLAEAEAVIAVLQQQADDFKKWEDDPENQGHAYSKEGESRRAAMLDPSFACDYTGTTYCVWAVQDDPRATTTNNSEAGEGSHE
jgi:hypothetical protein